MENLIVRMTGLVKHMIAPYISEGDTVVDATCGNGHDTVMLRQLVGPEGTVYSFDVQEAALDAGKRRMDASFPFTDGIALNDDGLKSESDRVHWILDSHENMERYISPDTASAILFNLGYLPGGDKRIVTKMESTVHAVESAIGLIRRGGIVSVTVYPGHEEGLRERNALYSVIETLSSRHYHALHLTMMNQTDAKVKPPELILITRKK